MMELIVFEKVELKASIIYNISRPLFVNLSFKVIFSFLLQVTILCVTL